MKHRILFLIIVTIYVNTIFVFGNKKADLPIKQIVANYYKGKPLYIGCAGHQIANGKTSGDILHHEFNYVTPSNDFKQTIIHSEKNN